MERVLGGSPMSLWGCRFARVDRGLSFCGDSLSNPCFNSVRSGWYRLHWQSVKIIWGKCAFFIKSIWFVLKSFQILLSGGWGWGVQFVWFFKQVFRVFWEGGRGRGIKMPGKSYEVYVQKGTPLWKVWWWCLWCLWWRLYIWWCNVQRSTPLWKVAICQWNYLLKFLS